MGRDRLREATSRWPFHRSSLSAHIKLGHAVATRSQYVSHDRPGKLAARVKPVRELSARRLHDLQGSAGFRARERGKRSRRLVAGTQSWGSTRESRPSITRQGSLLAALGERLPAARYRRAVHWS